MEQVEQLHFVNPQQLEKKSIGKRYILIGVLLLLIIGGSAYYFTQMRGKKVWDDRTSVFNDLNKGKDGKAPAPVKNVINPLTGVMYTEAEARDWKDLRPLGVMINNHPDARPQAGLIDADFTYEIVAEGGITRFLAFYQSVLPERVGPIRSTREYFLVMVREIGDAMLMHYGYSPQARVAIDNWPVRSLQIGGIEGVYCQDCIWRDQSRVDKVAWEHTLFGNTKKMVQRGINLGWGGKSDDFYVWQFRDDKNTYASAPDAAKISYDFWYNGDFSAMWQYDPASNTYSRYMGYDQGGKFIPHLDDNTQKQISVTNLIVQFATETKIAGDAKNRLDYTLTGSGKGYVFMDGKVVEITWNKADRDARTKYFDTNGAEIKFNRGKFWVAILPDRSPENLKFGATVTN